MFTWVSMSGRGGKIFRIDPLAEPRLWKLEGGVGLSKSDIVDEANSSLRHIWNGTKERQNIVISLDFRPGARITFRSVFFTIVIYINYLAVKQFHSPGNTRAQIESRETAAQTEVNRGGGGGEHLHLKHTITKRTGSTAPAKKGEPSFTCVSLCRGNECEEIHWANKGAYFYVGVLRAAHECRSTTSLIDAGMVLITALQYLHLHSDFLRRRTIKKMQTSRGQFFIDPL